MRLKPRCGVEGVEAHHFHCRLTPLYLISDGFACIDFGVLLIDERLSLRELHLGCAWPCESTRLWPAKVRTLERLT